MIFNFLTVKQVENGFIIQILGTKEEENLEYIANSVDEVLKIISSCLGSDKEKPVEAEISESD